MTSQPQWRAAVAGLRQKYDNLSQRARAALLVWAIVQVGLVALVWWYTPRRLFENLAAWANELQQSSTGWIWLILTISATSFPPMIGWTTCCMITGFGFGIQKGFFIALAGTVVGSMTTFTIARYFLARYAKQVMDKQTTMRALGGAITSNGLSLVCLVRLCPFPYSYANFFFASLHEVTPVQFLIATLTLSLKILLHVYVGTRLYLFSDPNQRQEMDSTTKWLNILSIVASILLAAGVGAYVYRKTMAYVADGQVHLIEDDLEAFLEEEARLEEQESHTLTGAPASRKSLDTRPFGEQSRLFAPPDEDANAWSGAFDDDFGSEPTSSRNSSETARPSRPA